MRWLSFERCVCEVEDESSKFQIYDKFDPVKNLKQAVAGLHMGY